MTFVHHEADLGSLPILMGALPGVLVFVLSPATTNSPFPIHATRLTMPIRRRMFVVTTASVLMLSILALFFFDIDLPSMLDSLKLATLHKLDIGNDQPQSNEFHILPVGEPFIHEDDHGDDITFEKTSPSPDSHDTIAGSFDTDNGPYSQGSIVSLSSTFETTIPNGATIHGLSIFDNLIVHNGTFYLVTNNPTAFPAKANIARKPDRSGEWGERDPDEQDFKFISPEELVPLLGDSAIRVAGSTWIMYDVWQFMKHYYHWWGEIILGGWRVWSLLALDSDGTFHPERLDLPDRFLIPMVTDGKWRDKAGIDGPLMRAAFPQAAIEERDQWLDLTRLNSTIVFDRALIINRKAAETHPFGGRWFKMIAGTQELQVPEFSLTSPSSHRGFWSPIRESLTRNLLGYIPEFASLTDRTVLSPPLDKSTKPVVTYVSRQSSGRRLTEDSDKSLVDALRELEAEGLCEVQIVRMENLSLKEQVRVVARSAIMVGVHGNGLTHQLWMPPSARSTVIEIVYPGAYTFDYEMLARNVGHKHYMAWNDTLITYAKGTYHKGVKFPEGFHSANIYVHGPAIAQKVKERLLGTEGDDVEKPDV